MKFFDWLFTARIRVYWLFVLLAMVSVCVYGWFISPEAGEMCEPGTRCGNGSHYFGLKFMPKCTPFGGNSTCGADLLLLIPFLLLLVIGVVTEEEMNK